MSVSNKLGRCYTSPEGDYGLHIHMSIQESIDCGDSTGIECVDNYLLLFDRVETEVYVRSDTLVGRVDAIGWRGDKPTLIDWKTGKRCHRNYKQMKLYLSMYPKAEFGHVFYIKIGGYDLISS